MAHTTVCTRFFFSMHVKNSERQRHAERVQVASCGLGHRMGASCRAAHARAVGNLAKLPGYPRARHTRRNTCCLCPAAQAYLNIDFRCGQMVGANLYARLRQQPSAEPTTTTQRQRQHKNPEGDRLGSPSYSERDAPAERSKRQGQAQQAGRPHPPLRKMPD